MRKPRGYWNKEMVRQEFYKLKTKLGRAPLSTEMPGVAVMTIIKGRYNPSITTWNGFLRDLGEEVTYEIGKWNKETVKKSFYELTEKLGRSPRLIEMPRGAVWTIKEGNYDPNIKTWNGFLKDIGEEIIKYRSRWNKKSITKAFYACKKELGRNPTFKEFGERYGGPAAAVQQGKYSPDITTWNGFLKDIGEKINRVRIIDTTSLLEEIASAEGDGK